MLKKALEEREASGGGFDGFDGGDGGMRIATITAVARAFNNASRRRPQVSHTHGESSTKFSNSLVLISSYFVYNFHQMDFELFGFTKVKVIFGYFGPNAIIFRRLLALL